MMGSGSACCQTQTRCLLNEAQWLHRNRSGRHQSQKGWPMALLMLALRPPRFHHNLAGLSTFIYFYGHLREFKARNRFKAFPFAFDG